MLYTARAFKGMVVTPHRLASEAGLDVLRKGGNAAEAALAAAAVLCVVYPHMTGLGGDCLWLMLGADESEPLVIEGIGRSAALASYDWYADQGLRSLPVRGPLACLTMAGAVSAWEEALQTARHWSTEKGRSPLEPAELLLEAIALAEEGYPVSTLQSILSAGVLAELSTTSDFARTFCPGGKPPLKGQRLLLRPLSRTLRRLAQDGFDSFYRGDIAEELADDLHAAGSPLRLEDFHAHRAARRTPLTLEAFDTRLFNCPPPAQGVASLMILGILDHFSKRERRLFHDEAALVHAVTEATKQAFNLREHCAVEPGDETVSTNDALSPSLLASLADAISPDEAKAWPLENPPQPESDTVWFGVADERGNIVSCIQSIYHEFGSGLVLPKSGVVWHNRGLGFAFRPTGPNALAPKKRPFHTLNPAMARFEDGRVMAYGSMGGDGQPQTQAAIFMRYTLLHRPLQAALIEPRWLLGRAWGEPSQSLKLENRFPPEVVTRLREMGHTVELVSAFSSLVGHAGAVLRKRNGLLEGAFDPRSDGSVGCR